MTNRELCELAKLHNVNPFIYNESDRPVRIPTAGYNNWLIDNDGARQLIEIIEKLISEYTYICIDENEVYGYNVKTQEQIIQEIQTAEND